MEKSIWKVSDPIFESDKLNPQLKFAYWEGHRNFIYDFLNLVKPQHILELGSQYGCSLFAMAQSVKDHELDCTIDAVDFWKGNIGAPDIGERVFSLVKETKESFYSGVKLNLHQMGFDDARSQFSAESVDLIHIDGGHRYEDVDHDFNLWLPTLKNNGIVLFHDVYSAIDQGSCNHWEYIKEHYDVFFDFPHSCGLGILFPKGDFWYQRLVELGFFPHIHDVYLFKAKANYLQERFDELAELYEQRYHGIEQQSEMIAERDRTITEQKELLDARYVAIQKQSEMIVERDEEIESQKAMAEERYNAIQKQSEMIAERDREIEAQKAMVEERYSAIQRQSEMIAERDREIEAQKAMAEERYSAIQKQSEMIAERDREIEAQKAMVEERYAAIQAQSKMIDDRDHLIQAQVAKINKMEKLLHLKQEEIEEKTKQIKLCGEELEIAKDELHDLKAHYWKIKKPSLK